MPSRDPELGGGLVARGDARGELGLSLCVELAAAERRADDGGRV